jgi:phosphatidylinositol-3-phosphatase
MCERPRRCSALLGFAVAAAAGAQPTPDHTVIVVEENHSQADVIGSTDAPYINWLAQNGALLTNCYALVHPSQPNYLHLFSGDDQGITNDTPPAAPFTTPNLGAALLASGRTFVGYSEDLPAMGSLVVSSGVYWRKHNPWSDWQASPPGANQLPPQVNRPFTDFPADFAALPTVAFVVPNQNNDMHDGTIAQADAWLASHLGPYADWCQSHNSLLIVTWDEDSSASRDHIPTILYGPMVRTGAQDSRWTLHNLLRTVEDMHGLPHSGASARVRHISGVFAGEPAPTNFTFQQGAGGYVATNDTWIEAANPDAPHDAEANLVADGSPLSQGLIRFDQLFGTQPGRIPPGASIVSAKLAFYTGTTASDASLDRMDLYRLTVPFPDGATWNSMGAGVGVGSETASTADFSFKPRNNNVNVIFDVTETLALWQAGASNRGWAIIPSGTDGWRPASADAGSAADRPRLDVAVDLATCVPAITLQPVDTRACVGASRSFVAAAASPAGVAWSWRKDGQPLSDGGHIAGAATATLTISQITGADAGLYDCIMSNACGQVVSAPAMLWVNSADFNGDGDLGTDADIEAFFSCLGGECCPACGSADFDADGDIGTDADIEAFFRVLAGGAC